MAKDEASAWLWLTDHPWTHSLAHWTKWDSSFTQGRDIVGWDWSLPYYGKHQSSRSSPSGSAQAQRCPQLGRSWHRWGLPRELCTISTSLGRSWLEVSCLAPPCSPSEIKQRSIWILCNGILAHSRGPCSFSHKLSIAPSSGLCRARPFQGETWRGRSHTPLRGTNRPGEDWPAWCPCAPGWPSAGTWESRVGCTVVFSHAPPW